MNSPLSPLDKVPGYVQDSLRDLTVALQHILGETLHSLVLHGSVARDAYRPEVSNVDLLVILNHADSATLAKLADALANARYRANIEAMILVADEIPRSADVFPLLYRDLRDNHLVLCGPDIFLNLQISDEHVRLRIEQELRDTLVRMRRVLVDTAGHPEALARPLVRRVKQMQSPLRNLLALAGVPIAGSENVVEATARHFGIDASPLREVSKGSLHAAACFMNVLGRAIDYIDSWEGRSRR